MPASQYNLILRQKTFYNFIVKKRFLVAKDIICRYLVPLPQVVALFSFIYPWAYLDRLQKLFGQENKEILLKQMKRIKIYLYYV